MHPRDRYSAETVRPRRAAAADDDDAAAADLHPSSMFGVFNGLSAAVQIIFGLVAFVAFVILVVAAVKMDWRAADPKMCGGDDVKTALALTFAALFLLPLPVVNLALAIAAIVFVNRLEMPESMALAKTAVADAAANALK